jgi:ComF family protein
MNFAKEISHSLVHIFFPHVCVGCGNDGIDDDQLLCIQCLSKLPLTNFQSYPDNPVEKIFWGRAAISSASCQYYYTKNSILRQILHDFKYNGKKNIGIFFGQIMGNALIRSNRFNDIDALIPLPLFAAREKKRGYNQAAILSEGISSVAKIPVLKNAIVRTSSTETQTKKSRLERWQNMSGKFEVKDRNCLENKHLLLVDDVITTGATLDACANELLLVKGARVSIATLAYTTEL